MTTDIRIEWHSPDRMFAAVLLRDGEPWYLDGAMVGMGDTWPKAVADLVAIAKLLILQGENFLSDGPIPLDDRAWLFNLFDQGNDVADMQERYEAMRQAGMGGATDEPKEQ